MDFQIIIGLILTVLPIIELRGGLPVVVEYALKNNVSIWPYFAVVIFLNILVIFFIFFFLDFLHSSFMNLRFYERFMSGYLERVRKKAEKVQSKMQNWGYFALCIFVAVPLPGTGAWTGTIIAWVLGLNRLKSIIAISLGVIIAGFLILLLSLGLFSFY